MRQTSKDRALNPICEWCGLELGYARKFPRVIVLPPEYGSRRLYFHEACLQPFKDANPNLMRKKEEEALSGNVK